MNSRGFTLIETLATIAIASVVMAALGFMIQYFYKANAFAFEQAKAIDSARRSVDNTASNLREASYGADGSYPIAVAATSTVTFYADITGTSVIERVHYYLASTTLYRGTTQPIGNPASYVGQPEIVTLVIDNVRNGTSTPIFTYYDNAGTLLGINPNVSKITSVHATVLADVNPLRAPNVYTLSAGATLRNLQAQK